MKLIVMGYALVAREKFKEQMELVLADVRREVI